MTKLKLSAVALSTILLVGCNSSEGFTVNAKSVVNPSEEAKTPTAENNQSIDTVAPVITLNGNATMRIENGEPYIEQGATAIDDIDGNVEVTISGSIDTSVDGIYRITYTAVDKSGNKTIATRDVTVSTTIEPDTIAPVITLEGSSTMSLKVGSTYIEQGATARDNVDGNVDVAISGSVDTTKSGIYTISYSAMDSSNNKATATRMVTVESDVIPNTPPVVDAGSNQSVEVYQSITVTGSASDANQDALTYKWINGSGEILSTNLSFSYTATTVGNDVLTLEVGDGEATVSDTVTITVTEVKNTLPIVNAGVDMTTEVNTSITITGTASDADNDNLIYEWRDESNTLRSTALSLEFTPTSAGEFTFTLSVSDGKDSVNDTMKVTVAEKGITDQEAVDAAKADLDFTDIANGNPDADNVATDLDLITKLVGHDGVVIGWSSSDETTINSTTGVVTQPEDDDSGKEPIIAEPIDVILTATLSKGDIATTKEIKVTVLPKKADELPTF